MCNTYVGIEDDFITWNKFSIISKTMYLFTEKRPERLIFVFILSKKINWKRSCKFAILRYTGWFYRKTFVPGRFLFLIALFLIYDTYQSEDRYATGCDVIDSFFGEISIFLWAIFEEQYQLLKLLGWFKLLPDWKIFTFIC